MLEFLRKMLEIEGPNLRVSILINYYLSFLIIILERNYLTERFYTNINKKEEKLGEYWYFSIWKL